MAQDGYRRCPSCRLLSPPDAARCGACGTAFPPPPRPQSAPYISRHASALTIIDVPPKRPIRWGRVILASAACCLLVVLGVIVGETARVVAHFQAQVDIGEPQPREAVAMPSMSEQIPAADVPSERSPFSVPPARYLEPPPSGIVSDFDTEQPPAITASQPRVSIVLLPPARRYPPRRAIGSTALIEEWRSEQEIAEEAHRRAALDASYETAARVSPQRWHTGHLADGRITTLRPYYVAANGLIYQRVQPEPKRRK